MAVPRIRKRKRGDALSVNFENVANAIKRDMVSHMADAVKEGFREIVTGTPVDTGYARHNWTVLFSGVKFRPLDPKNLSQVYPGVGEIMERENLKFEAIRRSSFGQNFRITNSTPYIYVLENKHSTQRDFVKRGMTKMKIALESSMKKRTN